MPIEPTMVLPSIAFLLFALLSPTVQSWYTCGSVDFCSRLRNNKATGEDGKFSVDLSNLDISFNHVSTNIVNGNTGKVFSFELTALSGDVYRVVIDDSENPRHRVEDALSQNLVKSTITVVEDNTRSVGQTITLSTESSKVVIQVDPFIVQFYYNDVLASVINSDAFLTIEEDEPNVAVGVDVLFPGANNAYGLPSHAESIALRDTVQSEPYRLYNIPRTSYGNYETQALYGAVPVLYAHSAERAAGLFWLNSAQTFVDIEKGSSGVKAFFMSESGAVEFFVLTGPTLKDSVKQYASLTGTAPLPQYWTLGYHQSRYSYESSAEVETVVNNFDANNFPLDAIWLDIDSTNNYRYFTWDSKNFEDPIALQETLNSTGRKLLAIVNPHYAVDDAYSAYNKAEFSGYFVKNSDGSSYQAQATAGLSSWIDFLNPEARQYYASLFSYDKFEGSTNNLFIWNDENEPAINGGDENTFPKDLVHYGGWKHRDVHNQYGFYQALGTYEGLYNRSEGNERPFVLSRSHFAGSQRYSAIWTGDNTATWEQLRIVFPMCLSEALAGISFCGADIGGFFHNCPNNLLIRWYQAGAWIPFFRQHSNYNVQRREPYLFEDDVQERIRKALQIRYKHLPYWYTLFYEHYRTGEPVIKPLVYNYPTDENVASMDQQFLVGDSILVCPITEDNTERTTCYLPGGTRETWYDFENTLLYWGLGNFQIRVDLSSNLYFYRGGSIIPIKDTIRSSSVYTLDDPITLYVFLNSTSRAVGSLYIDDTTSFNYLNKEYKYIRFTYANGVLRSEKIDNDSSFSKTVIFDKTIIYRPPTNPSGAKLHTKRSVHDLNVTYNVEGDYLTIENINHDLREPFEIQLH